MAVVAENAETGVQSPNGINLAAITLRRTASFCGKQYRKLPVCWFHKLFIGFLSTITFQDTRCPSFPRIIDEAARGYIVKLRLSPTGKEFCIRAPRKRRPEEAKRRDAAMIRPDDLATAFPDPWTSSTHCALVLPAVNIVSSTGMLSTCAHSTSTISTAPFSSVSFSSLYIDAFASSTPLWTSAPKSHRRAFSVWIHGPSVLQYQHGRSEEHSDGERSCHDWDDSLVDDRRVTR